MDSNLKKMSLYIPDKPDNFSHINSLTYITLPDDLILYIFIFHEDYNIPHIHLINIEKSINISIRLDTSKYYYHNSNMSALTIPQKEYLYTWMNDIHIDNFGNKTTNWEELIFNWKITNSKFEEEYYDQGNIDEYDWNKIFPNKCPDYRLLSIHNNP